MAEARKLDKIDRNILKHLQADAGLTNAELAGRVNLSPTAAMRRVDKLKEDGIIRKVVALADPAKLDLTTLVIVGVVLDRSTRHRSPSSRTRRARCRAASNATWSPASSTIS